MNVVTNKKIEALYNASINYLACQKASEIKGKQIFYCETFNFIKKHLNNKVAFVLLCEYAKTYKHLEKVPKKKFIHDFSTWYEKLKLSINN